MDSPEDFKAQYDSARHLDARDPSNLAKCGVCQNCRPFDRRLPQNPNLCTSCQQFDDPRHIFCCQLSMFNMSSLERSYRAPPKTITQLEAQDSCILCRVVLEAVLEQYPEFKNDDDPSESTLHVFILGVYHFGETGNVLPPEIQEAEVTQSSIKCIIYLITGPDSEFRAFHDNKEFRYGRTWLNGMIGLQVILHYSEAMTMLASVERWDKQSVDFASLRSCIDDCLFNHEYCTSLRIPLSPSSFRVVDVHQLCITEPRVDMPYIALSYLWKQAVDAVVNELNRKNYQELHMRGALAEHRISALIWDAILFCRQIGEQYLWIDRYCIVQDDPEDKHGQIMRMDRVYRFARFTLVAATANTEINGLPGVLGRSRPPGIQNTTRNLSLDSPSMIHNIHLTVDQSQWNKRGWTYQERVVSRRCIILTEYQSYFICSQNAYQEELGAVPSYLSEQRADNTQSLGQTIRKSANQLLAYFIAVEDYTCRTLTYDDDILNAFAGVGNGFMGYLNSKMIFGLPERYMAQALLWGPVRENSMSPRALTNEVPTWSWAHWRGAVQYIGTLGDYNWFETDGKLKAHSTFNLVPFWTVERDGKIRKLGQDRPRLEGSHSDKVEASVDASLAKSYQPLWKWNVMEAWEKCPQSILKPINDCSPSESTIELGRCRPGNLIFTTTTARLRLRHLDQWEDRNVIDICNQDLKSVGRMMKSYHEWARKWLDFDKFYDFVVLCASIVPPESRRGPMRDKDLWDESDLREKDIDRLFPSTRRINPWLLRVMLVERDIQEPSVCRRIAVGSIEVRSWQYCSPRWETIILV